MKFSPSKTQAVERAALNRIAAQGGVTHFPANTEIITEGDKGNSLYIILSGQVKVFASAGEGRTVVINRHGPGEYVGELALDGGLRSASVVTLEPTSVAIVSCVQLREFIGAHPDFALHLIHNLIGRLRRLTGGFKSLALEDVYTRVVDLLQDLSRADGDLRVIPQRMTQQEVAEHVGASREMVSRILKDLKEGGYIKVEARRITLLKKLPVAW